MQEHIGEVRESLPGGYYRELPELANGPLAGYPRVYELAITLISHTEGRIDLQNTSGFVAAFQQSTTLTIGELWAIPAMLRLGLIENVRRMALRTVQRLDRLEEADAAVAKILTAEGDDSELDAALKAFVAKPPPLDAIFVARFLQQLRTEGGAHPVLHRLEQWVTDEAFGAEEATSRSTQRLALTQIAMANSISSLRAVGRMDWKTFVESQSRIEQVLRTDPSGDYSRMTFETRDRYRHVVENIAKRTRKSEAGIAELAIECARQGAARVTDDARIAHVGYYLVDEGLPELERLTGYRPDLGDAMYRWIRHHPDFVFVGGLAAATAGAVAALFWLGGEGVRVEWLAVALLAFIPANDIAVSVVNQLVTALLPPRLLPKLDLREHGIPPEFRTAVVIPTLFGSVAAVEEALENLEVQFLANREANLYFALLSDFTDAAQEARPEDAGIVAAAAEGVRELNRRYAPSAGDAFYLFHRPRRWNPHEGVWMGWERKRGKLAEFNRFVLGGEGEGFSTIVGDVAPLRSVRYVITLDSDTVLPPESAAVLIGALAHPLNRAVYDPARGRVVRGYGILQPRVGVSLPSAHRSLFAAIHSGHPGVDPYTTAVSDVYQDLYGEGSFAGKGAYDVAAFEQATGGRFPENTLLSHDLIEGNYARAGLATDVIVYDDYPARYLTYTRRKHRWTRGDWQLLPWLRPSVPAPEGREPNRLSLLSRWKIVDNLRRSVVEIAQLVFLLAGWIILPVSPVRWTLIGLGAIAAPWVVALLLALVRPPFDKSWRAYYGAVGRDAVTSAQQFALAVVYLPHQAGNSLDAILRALWRMGVSRKHLLEWQTAVQAERAMQDSVRVVWRAMWPAALVAAAVLGIIIWRALPGSANPAPLWQLALGLLPFVIAWAVAPAIAHALGAPAVAREQRLSPESRGQAIRYALLHWRYFDTFVTEESNWLAPDNFQEAPTPTVALRTSPTNIGLQLLSVVSAADLGFLSIEQAAERLERALRSLERMRRFRGHFYNWYDLRDLRVLEPGYISTVDSGNLAGHLIALRQACLQLVESPIVDSKLVRSVETALDVASLSLLAAAEKRRDDDVPTGQPPLPPELAAARAAARGARTVALTLPVLEHLTGLLRQAEAALHARGPEDTYWVSWALALIESQRQWLTLTATRPAATLRDLADASPDAQRIVSRLEALGERAFQYAMDMDFGFLFDGQRRLFAIGFQQTSHTLDGSYYDLLASEARLASFLAIAKNDVPVEHWFRLGRTLTRASGAPALVSWSGSMFEYLMPMLVMRSFPFTVLAQTYEGAVQRHAAYGTERSVPWGISESAYNLRDRSYTYQYRAFGVPDLALKRGLGRDLVVAPYASLLAAMVEAKRALPNLTQLEALGLLGPYGFRDAVDFTRPEPDREYAIIRTYMAHHIGMGLVALTNILTGRLWQRRFHADPMVRAAELLLHERIPRRLVIQRGQGARLDEALPEPEMERPAVREIDVADTPRPHVALLGQLPYTIMISHCGGGYSRYEGLAVTRWRSDGTRDSTGQFCYVRDNHSGAYWSATHQPVGAPADWYRAFLATDRVTIHRADGPIETRTEVAVVPEDSAEVRRVTVTNNSDQAREVDLTSYGEIVLTTPESDRSHPAFANLFVETEYHAWCSAITATRRPRSGKEAAIWCVHVVATGPELAEPVTCETDRARFIGRGRSTANPASVETGAPLSGTTGAVLDPVFALRVRLRLEPGQSASVSFTTLIASNRELAFELADRYHDPHATQRALDLAWTSTQIELRELGVSPAEAAVFQELAGDLLYGAAARRAPQAELQLNRGSQPLLWSVGVSGDWPILLATIDSADGLPTLRQLLTAHRYWRRRGMTVDLVILKTQPTQYLGDLSDRVTALLHAVGESGVFDQSGGVFIRQADQIGATELAMLRATARVHIACDGRALGRITADAAAYGAADEDTEVDEALPVEPRSPERRRQSRVARTVRRIGGVLPSFLSPLASESAPHHPPGAKQISHRSLAPGLDNGFGRLTSDGAYEIEVAGDRVPPAPWINVVANQAGGFIVSERGGGCSWAENSHFYRLTPWHNDPVSDPVTDAIYLQDAEVGGIWSATPGPVETGAAFTVRHGQGYSAFESVYEEIRTHLTLGMADEAPVRVSVLRVTNESDRPRRLVITSYLEWSLGALREHTQHTIHTSFDAETGTIYASNTFDASFASWLAFHSISAAVSGHTASRRDFLGRNGTPAAPAALVDGEPLGGRTGVGRDPCAALQCILELDPGETREIVLILGAAATADEARSLVIEHRDGRTARAALDHSIDAWSRRLSVVKVSTPESSFDAMINVWTLYQALSCRMWGRTALYQSSGAYGFRDQLQDSMAFLHAEPGIAREHLLRAASRQFLEGDVQHWWHPHSGRGVRTRFSDDLAWLPFVAEHYVTVTGDAAVLDEEVPFLSMRPLEPDEHEVYDLPQVTEERASVYEHCVRALRRACTTGVHGHPLIGIGDWNDGMNRVGVEGRGESVWLAWFLITTLRSFARLAEARADDATAAEFRGQADAYSAAIEEHAWDGAWYRRAWFDDGTPLGSAQSQECRIDSIAQSWSVISGAGDPERQARAMQSLEEHLVREDARLIMLLTPPFDETPLDPGYIKGYLPGVRENGAQYTHAALWAVLATALRGDGDRALELYQMINPLTHAKTPEDVATYKVEPYVVAADVYTAEGHLGRGGWTWYTGSASWMYRVGVEGILGLTKRGNALVIEPRAPAAWQEYAIEYRFGEATYAITIRRDPGVTSIEATVDGERTADGSIPLADDGRRHEVLVRRPG
ncbi:MAG TPA: glucoamylase family protein [Gemmatimonadales bacterium]|nr:glucoamylase family protein [Gemmatimonadales bacterium]